MKKTLDAAPYILAQSAVPVILAPSGTVAADGTITLGTALPVVYAGAWVRLPAGAVVGGAAGLYWAVFSSTTVGAVKTPFADPAQPFVPYVPVGMLSAAVGSGAAYTQTTGADVTLANITLPGGVLGANGQWRVSAGFSNNSSAGSKTGSLRIGASLVHGRARTTTIVESFYGVVRNRGAQNKQITLLNNYPSEPVSSGTSPYYTFSVDTSADQPLTLIGQIAVATDYLVLEFSEFEVRPS